MIQSIASILFIVLLISILLLSFIDKQKKRTIRKIPNVSFIVPCYNDGDSVEDTIKSIYEVAGKNTDIIVINDKSTDNSRGVLDRLYKKHNFTIFHNDKNLGKSASLNKYSTKAKYDIIFFVDADVIVNKKSFFDVLARLKSKKVGGVSAPYVPKNKGFIPLMQNIEYNMMSLVQGSYNVFSAIALWGGFIGVKKEAFFKAGKFSINAITEDMDLAFKLNEHGYKVEQSFFPIKTYVPDKFKMWFKQKIRWSSGGFQCFIKHLKVWIKNPIHVLFLFSYSIFMISAVFVLIKNIFFFNNVITYFIFVNETVSLLTSLKLTGILYSAYIIKDILWMLAFTSFSLPYVIPLITKIKKIYLALLVIPFSIIYIPIFSTVSLFGAIYFLYNRKKYRNNVRAW
ncbi:MAG: glycosyltransferase [Nanoarchaeota archaeon]